MKHALKSLVLLVLLLLGRQAGLGLPFPPQQGFTVSGIISGRAGKPLAKAWVCLGRLAKDDIGKDTDLSLTEFSAVADDKGSFQIKGVPAGTYTLLYRPAPAGGAKPAPGKGGGKISVVKLSAVMQSFMPMIRDREVGTREPFAERPWTAAFTLMKGHTLFCHALGPQMKIWNASVRSGRQGPFLEMRKGQIWTQNIQKDTQLKFEAWSF